MRKFTMICMSLVLIISVAACSAGVGPRGAGVSVGYLESQHYSV